MIGTWVLRLKEEFKWDEMSGDYYFNPNEDDSLTDDLQNASLFKNKDETIQEMKRHERFMINRYGEDAIVNEGYTNMMKNFEFVEVEVEIVEVD